MFKILGLEKKEVNLKLVPGSTPGSVRVEACNSDGSLVSHLFKITPDGKLHRYRGVKADIGLKLDELGRVVLD